MSTSETPHWFDGVLSIFTRSDYRKNKVFDTETGSGTTPLDQDHVSTVATMQDTDDYLISSSYTAKLVSETRLSDDDVTAELTAPNLELMDKSNVDSPAVGEFDPYISGKRVALSKKSTWITFTRPIVLSSVVGL